jgi:hypothetical protein
MTRPQGVGSMANWHDDSTAAFDDFEPALTADAETAYRFLVERMPPATRTELGRLLLDIRTISERVGP